MERIKQIRKLLEPLFADYDEKLLAATEKQILDFGGKCKTENVSVSVQEQLVEFYSVTNSVPCLNGFDFHACDDECIFEWWNSGELWLGTCNDDVLRWKNSKFCLGDAGNVSYSHETEFDTLAELLEFAFKEWCFFE